MNKIRNKPIKVKNIPIRGIWRKEQLTENPKQIKMNWWRFIFSFLIDNSSIICCISVLTGGIWDIFIHHVFFFLKIDDRALWGDDLDQGKGIEDRLKPITDLHLKDPLPENEEVDYK